MIQWKTILELSESHLIRTSRIAMVGGGGGGGFLAA